MGAISSLRPDYFRVMNELLSLLYNRNVTASEAEMMFNEALPYLRTADECRASGTWPFDKPSTTTKPEAT